MVYRRAAVRLEKVSRTVILLAHEVPAPIIALRQVETAITSRIVDAGTRRQQSNTSYPCVSAYATAYFGIFSVSSPPGELPSAGHLCPSSFRMPDKSGSNTSKQSAKDVICELIAAAGGALRGKVSLNKAFYFAHLYYWRDASDVLTEHPIVRLPLGPCIDDASELLNDLVAEGRLIISSARVGPYEEYVYRLADEAPLIDATTPRGRAIREAIAFIEDKTGAELSEITHEHSRSWVTTPNGQEMNIYIDLVEDEELDAIRRSICGVRQREGEIWKTAF